MEIALLAITPDAGRIIETAGRTCYLSHDKMDEQSHERFIKRIVASGHHSVLEHAYATFRIRGCSRSFTHQIVRHRLAAFSQQSQRYVDEGVEFGYVVPPSIASNPVAKEDYDAFMSSCMQTYRKLRDMGVKKEDARFVLPNAVHSEIVISANFREWRHIIELRGDKHAQWEIRAVILEILRILKKEAPSAFADMEISDSDGCVILK